MNTELKAKIETGIAEHHKSGKRWEITSEEMHEALAAGWKNLQGAYLWGADLRSADLWYVDLQGANLQGANLQSTYLRDANLQSTYLRDANLQGADLGGADLGGADLGGAYLGGADLGGAYLGGAYLGGADLTGADLTGADLTGAKIDDGKTIAGYFTRTRIGSDNAELQIAYNATDIWIKRGCSGWLTPNEFLARVDKTHGDRLHGQIYRLTIKHICEVVEMERQFSAQGE